MAANVSPDHHFQIGHRGGSKRMKPPARQLGSRVSRRNDRRRFAEPVGRSGPGGPRGVPAATVRRSRDPSRGRQTREHPWSHRHLPAVRLVRCVDDRSLQQPDRGPQLDRRRLSHLAEDLQRCLRSVAEPRRTVLDDVRASERPFRRRQRAGQSTAVELREGFASEKGATPAQVSLAGMLHKKAFIVPIPDQRRLDRIAENLTAADVELSDSEFD
jgi:hypothetical protein